MPPKKRQTTKPKAKAKPKSKSTSQSSLNKYKLPEIKALAKRYGIVLSRKNKAQLIQEIEKRRRSKPQPKVKQITITRPTRGKKAKDIKIHKLSREIVYDSRQGGQITECIDGQCRQTKLPPPPQSDIASEPLYLPNVIDFMEENEPQCLSKTLPRYV